MSKPLNSADSSSLRPREALVKKLTHPFPTLRLLSHPRAINSPPRRIPPPLTSHPPPNPHPNPHTTAAYPAWPRPRPPATRRAAAAPNSCRVFGQPAPDPPPCALPVRPGSRGVDGDCTTPPPPHLLRTGALRSLDDGGPRRAARPKVSGAPSAGRWDGGAACRRPYRPPSAVEIPGHFFLLPRWGGWKSPTRVQIRATAVDCEAVAGSEREEE